MKIKKNVLLDELKEIGIIAALLLIVLKIVFYKEDLFKVFMLTISIIWLYTIPGLLLLHKYKKNMTSGEFYIISTLLGIGITGIISYHLGWLFMNYTPVYYLPAIMLLGYAIFSKK
jgi:hypothetical protein